MIPKITEKVWLREWTAEELEQQLGTFIGTYQTYAAAPTFRERAASGGSVSALLNYLLTTGEIDGALVCDTVIEDGKPTPTFKIATTTSELLAAQGSKYSAVYFTNHALPLIKSFEGRLAVVALPCDATILSRFLRRSPDLRAKVRCTITLFCGHNSRPELVDAITAKLAKSQSAPLASYRFRYGHWRGKLRAEYTDGNVVEKPFSYFSDYRNLYFFAQQKCHHCFDHFGYDCDISAGDIWSPHLRDNPIKHTALVSRTPFGDQIIQQALNDGALYGEDVSAAYVANGQARTAPFHYNVTARARVGKLLGIDIRVRPPAPQRVRLVDYPIAFIALSNERLSRSRWGQRLILSLPRPLLRAYLYLFKGLESL